MRRTTERRATQGPLLAFALMGAGWAVIAAYMPEIKARLGVGDAALGGLLLSSSIGLLAMMWAAPRLDARFGRLTLPFAAAAMALLFLAPGLAPGPLAFALGMAALGAASGLTDVVMNARVSEIEIRRGRPLMSFAHAVYSLTYAGAALLCAPAREAGLPAAAMLVLVGLVGLALASGMAGPRGAERDGGGAGEAAGGAVPWRLVILGGGIVLLGFLTENAMEGWSALHIERTLGGSAAMGALGPAVLGLTMGIGRLGGHVLGGLWREGRLLSAAALVAGAGLWLAALADTPGAAYLGFALAGLGVSVVAPVALSLVGRAVPSRLRTTALARVSVIGFAGFFLGPSLMGGLSGAAGLPAAFATVGTAVALVPLLARLLR